MSNYINRERIWRHGAAKGVDGVRSQQEKSKGKCYETGKEVLMKTIECVACKGSRKHHRNGITEDFERK